MIFFNKKEEKKKKQKLTAQTAETAETAEMAETAPTAPMEQTLPFNESAEKHKCEICNTEFAANCGLLKHCRKKHTPDQYIIIPKGKSRKILFGSNNLETAQTAETAPRAPTE